MKILVLGPSCSGKTTVCRHLRSQRETNAIDACDEILRLNDGVWPDIGRKNDVLLPQVVERVVAMDDVVLFNSYMHRPLLERLRAAGFQTVLLRVTEVELRRRHRPRQATEGWTNVQWLEWDLDHLKTLQAGGLIDESSPASRMPPQSPGNFSRSHSAATLRRRGIRPSRRSMPSESHTRG